MPGVQVDPTHATFTRLRPLRKGNRPGQWRSRDGWWLFTDGKVYGDTSGSSGMAWHVHMHENIVRELDGWAWGDMHATLNDAVEDVRHAHYPQEPSRARM